MKTCVALFCAAVLVCLMAFNIAPARSHIANSKCAPREALVRHLKRAYSEDQHALGYSPKSGNVIEIYVDDHSDDPSWSVVVVRPDGMACIVGVGTEWQIIPHDHGHGEES
jgi:hypothetical protein